MDFIVTDVTVTVEVVEKGPVGFIGPKDVQSQMIFALNLSKEKKVSSILKN